jgi:hypothetical protein
MRRVADSARIRKLMGALSEETEQETRIYFTGGASAVLLGWRTDKQGRLSFFHYDFYSQALAKIERGHAQDIGDVRHMLAGGRSSLDVRSVTSARSSRFSTASPRSIRRRFEEPRKESSTPEPQAGRNRYP